MRSVFPSYQEIVQGICKFLGIIHLFVGVFITEDIGDDEETYSIPVEYGKDVSSVYKSVKTQGDFDSSGC